jgi:type I restriction enzyme M protein
MLVKTSLVAVVSLPAGVFNPYSGVKTSILFMDKRVHKQTDKVLFVKVQNDGFNLGAQRRAVANSDLPQATRVLRTWMTAPTEMSVDETMAHAVARGRIGNSGDFNLSGGRYADVAVAATSFSMAKLGEICHINPEALDPAVAFGDQVFEYIDIAAIENGTGKFLGGTLIAGTAAPSRARRKVAPMDDLLSTVRPNLRAFSLLRNPPSNAVASTGFAVLRSIEDRVLPGYLIWMLRSDRCVEQMIGMSGKGAYPSINSADVGTIQVPLPPLEVQQQIVVQIEGYQAVVDGARQVLESYRPNVSIEPDWPTIRLGDVFLTKSGTTPSRDNKAFFEGGLIPWVKTLDLRDGPLTRTAECVTSQALAETHLEKLPIGTVLVAMYGGFNQIGRTGVLEIEATCNQAMTALLPNSIVDPYFLNVILISKRAYWKTVANSTRKDPNITKSDVLNFMLPLPNLATQRAILAEIEAEQALVASNRELIERFEGKIKLILDRVWSAA